MKKRDPREHGKKSRNKKPPREKGGPARDMFPGKPIMLQEGDATLDLSKPPDVVRIVIEDEDAGERIDAFLRKKMPWRSRTWFQGRIESGNLKIDGAVALSPSRKLRAGQVLELSVPPPRESLEKMDEIDVTPIYEDEWILVIDKPPRVLVHPTGKVRYGTLINKIHKIYKGAEDKADGIDPMLIHRIDAETSGVLMLSKKKEARAAFQTQFERRETRKKYLAIAKGVIPDDFQVIDLPIGPRLDSEIRLAMGIRTDEKGLPSRTDVKVIERLKVATLVECEIHTGRQHQIRVHLEAIGHPVLCDRYYGNPEMDYPLRASSLGFVGDEILLERHALHSHYLSIYHPFLSEQKEFIAPMPADMLSLLERLRVARSS
ncbi:MAG: RluA family pseudouridine synthase [Planctomycetes bacterium]|nr:RluA family pseudouridine synthase [Planctomycetota bacterium]